MLPLNCEFETGLTLICNFEGTILLESGLRNHVLPARFRRGRFFCLFQIIFFNKRPQWRSVKNIHRLMIFVNTKIVVKVDMVIMLVIFIYFHSEGHLNTKNGYWDAVQKLIFSQNCKKKSFRRKISKIIRTFFNQKDGKNNFLIFIKYRKWNNEQFWSFLFFSLIKKN